MRRNAAQSHVKADVIERMQLLSETACWLAAWLVLPIWLGVAGASPVEFLAYAFGAGALLAFGVAVDRSDGFSDLGEIAWFGALSCFAVLTVGGTLFGITTVII
jgi:hypothetical protein